MCNLPFSELHNIAPIRNLHSILTHGILSHSEAKKFDHLSVANIGVQNKRDKKLVPNGLRLHQYANLYFNGRNPMLYSICGNGTLDQVCILQISVDVINIPGVVLTDRNAASACKFLSPDEISEINFELVFAKYWTHSSPIETKNHGQIECAEILVPYAVPPMYITGIYTFNENMRQYIQMQVKSMPVIIYPYLFFKES